jgi:5-methylcytosine-specific restriction endonuclease McrA
VKEVLNHLKFQRYLVSADIPANEKGFCRWCGGKLKGRRRRWCSDDCINEFMIRNNGSVIRHLVWLRDNGVCAKCGIDIGSAYRYLVKLHILNCHNRAWENKGIYKKSDWGPWWDHNRNWWEADHIIPVIEGGGCCGLDNYQTLCIRCHKEETKKLAGRRIKK